jgi:hypothetical protein
MWMYWRDSRYYCSFFEQGNKLYIVHSVQYSTVNTFSTSTCCSNLFFITYVRHIYSVYTEESH